MLFVHRQKNGWNESDSIVFYFGRLDETSYNFDYLQCGRAGGAEIKKSAPRESAKKMWDF